MPTDEPESAPPDEPQPAIVIPESVREELLAHAREGAPEEVCGILAGTRGILTGTRGDGPTDSRVEPERRTEARHPAENVAENPAVRYEIDPREQLELMEAIEDSGHEVVGFYHSHPRGPAEPSATDAAQATWPDRSYVIVSLDGAENSERPSEVSVNSWRWTGDEFVEEAVRVDSS